MIPNRLRLRPYLRVSKDKSGRERSPNEQLTDLTSDCERNGEWALHGQPYRDVGSASRYARKARDDFDKLIADLQDGGKQFGADALALWESSRGSRKVGEWVDLLDLLEAGGKHIWVHTHGRLYDPRNHRDRRSLLEDAVDSEYEVGKASDRIRRTTRRNAAEGRPHGVAPFGYIRVYDERTRALIGQEPHPDEAPLVKEVFARLLQGHSLRAIALDFEARGIRNRAGNPYGQAHLRKWAINPAYTGWRIHAPEQLGTRHLTPDVTPIDAVWEPLVPRGEFLAVQEILSNPSRKTNESRCRPGRARHLVSMIARCEPCGHVMTVFTRGGKEGYRCQKHGCVSINKDRLDQFVTDRIVAYLERDEMYSRLRQENEVASEELQKLETALAEVRREIEDLTVKVEAGELSIAFAARVEPKLLQRKDEMESRYGELTAPSILRGLIEPGPGVAARWAAAELSTRRTLAKILFSPEFLGELLILRSPVVGHFSSRVPIHERVVLRRAQ